MAYRSHSADVSWHWFAPAARCSCYDNPLQWSLYVVVSPLTEDGGEKWGRGGGGRRVMKLWRQERRGVVKLHRGRKKGDEDYR